MARPVKSRRICSVPRVWKFEPVGEAFGEPIEMTVDEFETIRLIDSMGFSQEDCALQMNVSRTTVQAIYDSARKKLAAMLVKGSRLMIGGGAYAVCPRSEECCGKNCSHRKCESKRCRDGELICRECPEKHRIIDLCRK